MAEFSKELTAIAQRNIERYTGSRVCKNIEVGKLRCHCFRRAFAATAESCSVTMDTQELLALEYGRSLEAIYQNW
jgi:hypothetical protein